jgi:invasion protein IalB
MGNERAGSSLASPQTKERKGRLMISSKDRWNGFGRNAARMVLGASLLAIGVTTASVFAVAQQPNASSAPPRAPAGAPAAPADSGAQWVKLCQKSEQTGNKEICVIQSEKMDPNLLIVTHYAAVRIEEGNPKKALIIRMPTINSLVIPTGAQIVIDQQDPTPLPFNVCFPAACQADIELTDELLDKMRKGNLMVAAALKVDKKTLAFRFPLTGFSKALDGPPTDAVAFEKSRREYIAYLQRQRQELAAKARGAPAGAPQQPGAAPTPGAVPQPGAAPGQ